jgi:acetyl esterase
MQAEQPHPEVQSVLSLVEQADVLPLSQYGPERAREVAGKLRTVGAGPEVPTTDRTVPGPDGEIPVRVYRPTTDGEYPVAVYYHGGGWVIGDLDSHDAVCRHLCETAGAVVVAVDYRLAPEDPFPAAVRDAYGALEWVAANPEEVGGTGGLSVAGDSAGGALAAVVSLMARDRDGPGIDRQVLVYPVTSPSDDWSSRRQNAEGYYLVEDDMRWFANSYFGDDIHARNPYGLPMNACDLSGLPAATVVTAGFDPLRDEGVAYAERLREAGVDVVHRNYDDMIHGFVNMIAPPSELATAHEAVEAVASDL